MDGATNQRGARCALANSQQFPSSIDVALEIPSDGIELKEISRKLGEHGDCVKAVGGRRVASGFNEWEREHANGMMPRWRTKRSCKKAGRVWDIYRSPSTICLEDRRRLRQAL